MASVSLVIGEGEADRERLDLITRQLRSELLEFDAENVDFIEAPRPAHTKGAEAATLGALAVTLLPAVLPKLVDFLMAWVARGSNRSVKLKAQVGDRSIDLEYNGAVPQSEIRALLRQALGEG